MKTKHILHCFVNPITKKAVLSLESDGPPITKPIPADLGKFIVQACNHHAELVACLESIVQTAQNARKFIALDDGGLSEYHALAEQINIARALLAKVKGQP